MKNAMQEIIFPQELVDDLMKSFDEDNARLSGLLSPLSNMNLNEENEN